MDKPTPRTDAEIDRLNDEATDGESFCGGMERFARQLERERNELEQTVARLRADAERWQYGAKHGFPERVQSVTTSVGQLPYWYYKGIVYGSAASAIDSERAAIDAALTGKPK